MEQWRERPALHAAGVWQRSSPKGQAVLVAYFYGGPEFDTANYKSYQPSLYLPDGSILTTYRPYRLRSDAEAWCQRAERGEEQELAAIRYIAVPLTVGSRVYVVDGGLNESHHSIAAPPHHITGKMATVTSQRPGRPFEWYIQVDEEPEPERFSLGDGTRVSKAQIEASYYSFSPGPHGEAAWHLYEHDRTPWVAWLHPKDGGPGPTLLFLNREALRRFNAGIVVLEEETLQEQV